jgi:AdoMet-dependent rRNA methyltransferase SPB1
LAALKTATDHLVSGGTFCTKVYRSTDYNALIWVFQQLFEDVQAMKPNSSRSQSAEIFIICLRYTAPKHIDSKLFDPNHVFKEYDDPGLKKVDVLHKKYDKMNRRHRTGYDESLGVLLRSVVTVKDFVSSKDPIRLLTDASEIVFSDDCTQFKEHPSTTKEILACFADLRVLGKIDFKKLLKWRALMRDSIDPERTDDSGGRSALREEELSVGSGDDEEMTIEHIQESIARSEKKDKKKARLKASKERARQQLGMSGNAFSDSDDLELFSLANASRIDGVGDVDLDDDNLDLHVEEEQEDRGEGSGPLFIKSDDLEDQLEKDYRRYVARKRAIEAGSCQDDEAAVSKTSIETVIESRTTTAKELRRERRSESVIAKRSSEDQQSSKGSNPALEGDVDAYVKMLSRQEGDSSEEDEDGDDSDYDSFDGPQVKRMTAGSGGNADGGKWFSNPIFSYSLADGDELRRESAANVTLSQMPKTVSERL